ncbi:hypothetical protein [Parasphaerochaeta coccoides]|uniref:Uncharacterized protein n=1 Tax=Parasphaerochaeta coccoides (strain ATCC BAA-1237 / DSM 17374 / SPN1) TaxID=760011 RepID=F4GL44_PARC1|nr:hypothetical protein [Parasphaerochaeta coccoides]AEC02384.1 hypothetical protein Spico_1170 [Parasphaerochaeta coccoides DSM 17374]
MAFDKAGHIQGALQSFTQGIFDVTKLIASDIGSQVRTAASIADSIWDAREKTIMADNTLTSDEKLLKLQEVEQEVLDEIFASANVTSETAKKNFQNSVSWTMARKDSQKRMGAYVASEKAFDVEDRDKTVREEFLRGNLPEEAMNAGYLNFLTGGVNEDGTYKDPLFRPEVVESKIQSFTKQSLLTTVQRNAHAALDNDGLTLGKSVIDEAYEAGRITYDDKLNLEVDLYTRATHNQRAVSEQMPTLDATVQDIIANGVPVPQGTVATGTPYERSQAAIQAEVGKLAYATPTQKAQLNAEFDARLRAVQPMTDFKNFYLSREGAGESVDHEQEIERIASYYGMDDIQKADLTTQALSFMDREHEKKADNEGLKAFAASATLDEKLSRGETITLEDVGSAFAGVDLSLGGGMLYQEWVDFVHSSDDRSLYEGLLQKIAAGTATDADFHASLWHTEGYQKAVKDLQVEWKKSGSATLDVLSDRAQNNQSRVATFESYRFNGLISDGSYHRALIKAHNAGTIDDDDLARLWDRPEYIASPRYQEVSKKLAIDLGLDKEKDPAKLKMAEQAHTEALQLFEDTLMLNPDMDWDALYGVISKAATDNYISKLVDSSVAGAASPEAFDTEDLFKKKKPQEMMQDVRNGKYDGLLQEDRLLGWMSKTATTDKGINPRPIIASDLFSRTYENLSTFEKNVVDLNVLYIEYAYGMKDAAEKQLNAKIVEIRLTDRGPAVVDNEGYVYMPADNTGDFRDWTIHKMISLGVTRAGYLLTGKDLSPGTEYSANSLVVEEPVALRGKGYDYSAIKTLADVNTLPLGERKILLDYLKKLEEQEAGRQRLVETKAIERLSVHPALVTSEKKKDKTPK